MQSKKNIYIYYCTYGIIIIELIQYKYIVIYHFGRLSNRNSFALISSCSNIFLQDVKTLKMNKNYLYALYQYNYGNLFLCS